MATQVGKRYKCDVCGSEFIATKAGGGDPRCCNQPLSQK